MSIKISYSANSLYQRSPRAWYLHYQLGLRPAEYKGSFIIGGSIDEALNVLLVTKDRDKAISEFMKFFTAYKDNEGKKISGLDESSNIKWTKTEGDGKSWIKKAEMIIDAYIEQVLPHLKEVIAVQAPTQLRNDSGDIVRGVADLYAVWEQDSSQDNYNPELDKWNGKTILFDNKTTTIKYKPNSVKESEQLGTYDQDLLRDFEVEAAGYIVIPKVFRKIKQPLIPIQILIDKVDPVVIESIINQYEETLHGIKMGHFPCHRQKCSKDPFGCPYKNYCDNDGDTTGLIWTKRSK
jgi:hypothetical protein